ncbi:MAG: hypothetical protein Q4G60_04120 [bacterium]|nr:hypothetical protein [bacterium]
MELSEYKNNGRYLSIDIVYTIFSNRTANLSICNTVDMKTGEIVYLDDIIEVNDELVSMLLTEGTLKTVFDWMRGLEDVYYLQDVLDYYDPEMIRDNLEKCSEPYTKECGVHKPTFYIKNERLYFINLLGIESESYVEIDSIRDKLKIDL